MIWFENPAELIASDKLTNFWPSSKQSYDERINSSTRFILYSSLLAFTLRRDVRILLLGVLIILAVFLTYRLRPPIEKTYTESTLDNPMGNILMGDYTEFPDRSRAAIDPAAVRRNMNDIFPENTRSAERQFYSMPSTTIPNDLDAFLDFTYGGKSRPNCRENQMACTAENNPRMMERTQMASTFGGSNH
jgi:hypothetical protein